MKKFYKLVSTRQDEAGGHVVELDGKPVRTPGGRKLVAPARALADAIALEWSRQGEMIIPDSMPLTQILTTVLDYIPRERAAITDKLLGYLNTDLLCYRAVHPPAMAERQAACWDPWLSWFEKRYNAALLTTTGLNALTQPDELHGRIRREIAAMDDMRFGVLQMVTALAGSLVLALAFNDDEATPDEVFAAANAEEIYKAEIYDEAIHGLAPLQEQKQRAMKRDLEAARIFLASLSA